MDKRRPNWTVLVNDKTTLTMLRQLLLKAKDGNVTVLQVVSKFLNMFVFMSASVQQDILEFYFDTLDRVIQFKINHLFLLTWQLQNLFLVKDPHTTKFALCLCKTGCITWNLYCSDIDSGCISWSLEQTGDLRFVWEQLELHILKFSNGDFWNFDWQYYYNSYFYVSP